MDISKFGTSHNNDQISHLKNNEIFVFGSNLAGRHGKGAAYTAKLKFGACIGNGIGIQGNSYAIPTKDHHLNILSRDEIKPYVISFREYAECHSDLQFIVTRVGTGFAGYRDKDMAELFTCCDLPNIHLHEKWINIIKEL